MAETMAENQSAPGRAWVTFTVIIPAYNCAEWLDRSVASAFSFLPAQTEVIVVDDGSTDETKVVLARLQGTHQALRVLRQHNQGLSAARNMGIAAASGAYIVLLDADDELLQLPCLQSHVADVDMLRFGIEEVTLDGDTIRRGEGADLQRGVDHLAAAMRSRYLYPPSCIYAYRRSFLQSAGLRFVPGLLHEDMLFTVQALLAAPRFKAVSDIGYRYFRRAGSITDPADPPHLLRRLQSLRSIERSVTKLANRHAEVDLGWWSLHILDYIRSLAHSGGSFSARWVAFTAHCSFFLRYRRWGEYCSFWSESYRLRHSFSMLLKG